jgi:hypothetical protein
MFDDVAVGVCAVTGARAGARIIAIDGQPVIPRPVATPAAAALPPPPPPPSSSSSLSSTVTSPPDALRESRAAAETAAATATATAPVSRSERSHRRTVRAAAAMSTAPAPSAGPPLGATARFPPLRSSSLGGGAPAAGSVHAAETVDPALTGVFAIIEQIPGFERIQQHMSDAVRPQAPIPSTHLRAERVASRVTVCDVCAQAFRSAFLSKRLQARPFRNFHATFAEVDSAVNLYTDFPYTGPNELAERIAEKQADGPKAVFSAVGRFVRSTHSTRVRCVAVVC